ncbi:MAG: toxin-antitoxin system HicB family antitoxin [Cyanobacteria bacterium P01_C01_bin.72]
MSRLTLRLPETLHQQLTNLAKGEGISLNQYIIYALTRQVSFAYTVETISQEDIAKQQNNFEQLLEKLGNADVEQIEIEKVLSQREIVAPEPALTPDIIKRLKKKIKNHRP